MKNLIVLLTVITISSMLSKVTYAIENDSLMNTVEVTAIKPDTAGLNSEIQLTIENYTALIDRANEADKKLVLFINSLQINGIKINKVDDNHAEFFLRHTEESKGNWAKLLKQRDGFFTNKVSVSIGLEDEEPVKSSVKDFELIFVKKFWFLLCLGLFGIILILFIRLASKSNIIRDSGPKPKDSRKPFSIGRTQMAFWFFLVIVSFPLIWLITGEPSEITGSILALMGISSGTALGATAIDTNKLKNLKDKLLKNETEKPAMKEHIKEIETLLNQATSISEKENLNLELQDLKIKIKEIDDFKKLNPNFSKGRKSDGFINDILSDNTGFSFHRFQILIWTIVLGIIFIVEVISNLQMPEFDDTLLMLMGISSGTYIGFKFPEQQPGLN